MKTKKQKKEYIIGNTYPSLIKGLSLIYKGKESKSHKWEPVFEEGSEVSFTDLMKSRERII